MKRKYCHDILLHIYRVHKQRPIVKSSKTNDRYSKYKYESIKGLPTIVPPIELQLKYSLFSEQVDKSKVVVQKAFDEAQILFDSLMQKYF